MRILHQIMLLSGLLSWGACTQETQRLEDYEIQGIDISHHQGAVDWDELKAQEIDFVFIKATEGSEHRDTMFETFWEQAARAGITRGAYHYFSPFSPPEDQLRNFFQSVPLVPGDLPPVLDVEIRGKLDVATFRKNVLTWLEKAARHSNATPILYTNQKYYLLYFVGPEFEKYPLWIARYNSRGRPPQIPFGKKWTFWQYGNCGRLKGVQDCVDFNVFNGDSVAFRQILIPDKKREPAEDTTKNEVL